MIRSRLLVPPAAEPVTLDELKAQARIEHADDDTLLRQLIAAARESAEQRTGRALLDQTWQQRGLTRDGRIELRRWPVIDVLSVADHGGPLATERWTAVTGEAPEVQLPGNRGGEVIIDYRAGYGATTESVPTPIRQWILIAAATMYELREAEVPGATVNQVGYVDALLASYEVPGV